MQIKVLVNGVGGDVGQGVIKALKSSSLDLKIYAMCISHSSSWLYKSDNSYISPFSNSKEYIPFLIDFINEHKIDVFFPTVDGEILKISQNKREIEEKTGVKIFVDNESMIDICDDKYQTIVFLKNNGFDFPQTILASDINAEKFINNLKKPPVIKKRRGRGALDVFIKADDSLIKKYLGNGEYIFQEFLDCEDEYTSGVYLGDDSEIKGICTLKRELKCGSTYKAERILDEKIEENLKNIAKKLGMKYLNIQSKRVGDKIFPFEFNGRFSGTTGIISQKVFNAPEMFIKERFLKMPVEKSTNRDFFMVMRYLEEVYANEKEIEDLKKRSFK